MKKTKPLFQVYSLHDAGQQGRDYRKRKFKCKTKSGCQICKTKRVKCDESRPVCIRCQRNGWRCEYESSSYSLKLNESSGSMQMNGNTHPSSLATLGSAFIFSPRAETGTSTLALIHHFHTHWTEIFHTPHIHEIISVAKSHSLVRNTILAITACHLRHVSPGVLEHRIAEHFQQHLAINDYQKALNSPLQKLDQSGADALLLSGALLSILAFTLPYVETTGVAEQEPDPSMSWVFSSHKNRLDWLALQVGLKPFILSLDSYFQSSRNFMIKIFLGHEVQTQDSGRLQHVPQTIPEGWIEFFELGDASYEDHCESRSPFYPPVNTLVFLRGLVPVHSNVFKNLQFLGKVSPDFRALLYQRTEKALWLFGYWLGIMCRYEGIWWSDKRVRRDYKAICLWLERLNLRERPGAEGKAWREMLWELESAPRFSEKPGGDFFDG